MAPARLTAALLAAMGLAALWPPLPMAAGEHGGWLGGAWFMLGFFTIITNALLGLAFATIAWRGREAVRPGWLGCLTVSIVLVGLVFNLLLQHGPYAGTAEFLGDKAHHLVIPILAPLWWLAFAPKRRLGWRAPLAWVLYPMAYCAYAFARAQLVEPGTPLRYPYFFMDPDLLGWPQALLNIAGLALGFIALGYGLVWLDRALK